MKKTERMFIALLIVVLFFLLFAGFSCLAEPTVFRGIVVDKFMGGFHNDVNVLIIKTNHRYLQIDSREIYYNCEIGDKIIFTKSKKGRSIGRIANEAGYYTMFIISWRKE